MFQQFKMMILNLFDTFVPVFVILGYIMVVTGLIRLFIKDTPVEAFTEIVLGLLLAIGYTYLWRIQRRLKKKS